MSRRRKSLDPGARASLAARDALAAQADEGAFRELLERFLATGPARIATPALGVLASLAQGVILLREAAHLAAALPAAWRTGDADAYAYFDGLAGRRRCIKLNPIGVISRQALAGVPFTPEDAVRSFVDWLDRLGPDRFKAGKNRATQLAAVEAGARAFWSRHLPNVLLNDAAAVLTLRPLRPEALARRVTGQPLARSTGMVPGVAAGAATLFAASEANGAGLVLQQIVSIMSHGDATNLDALRGTQLQLLDPLIEQVEGDRLGTLLLIVASGICEYGTVDRQTPSHSISARYVRELARMFEADPDLAATLSDLTSAERRAAYEALRTHARDANDGRAALTTADMHWCEALGWDPVVPLQGDANLAIGGPARYLNATERQRVRDASPNLAPTTDIEVVVRAVAAMACTDPMRPGDMRDAYFEDLEIGATRAVLNLRRRHNRKGPKRVATEGPIEFTDASVVAALTALKHHRETQSAGDGCPLWGHDLQESRRIYTRACSLIDQACKQASGDVFESFYSLRHGLLTDEVHDALVLADPAKAQAALQRASRRARHRQIETTIEDYFHLGPEVAHKHVLRGLGTLLTVQSTAVWSGVRPDALKKRIGRSKTPPADTLWRTLNDAAPLGHLKEITEDFPCAPSPSSLKPTAVRLADVLGSVALTQIVFKDDTPQPAAVAELLMRTSAWERRLLAAKAVYVAQWNAKVRLAATRQAKLRPLERRLARYAESAAVRQATTLWRKSARRGYIDVASAPRLSAWLSFLVASGIPPSRLVLRIAPDLEPKLEFLSAIFSAATGVLPSVDGVPGGKDRPAAYLLIASMEPRARGVLPSAATSMAGFNALMLAACIREDVSEVGKEAFE